MALADLADTSPDEARFELSERALKTTQALGLSP